MRRTLGLVAVVAGLVGGWVMAQDVGPVRTLTGHTDSMPVATGANDQQHRSASVRRDQTVDHA